MGDWRSWDRAVLAGALRGGTGAAQADAFGPLPPSQQGVSGTWSQVHGQQQVHRQLESWFGPIQRLVDQARRGGGSTIVSPLRPDLQFNNPDRRNRPTYVEVDTDPRRLQGHIRHRDPRIRSVYLQVDPRTGALVRKHVYPVRGRSYVRSARPGRGLTLTRRDVFDE